MAKAKKTDQEEVKKILDDMNSSITGDEGKEQEHAEDCECVYCKYGMEALVEWEQKAIRDFGWFAHCITAEDPSTPTGVNYHTHGIAENLGHPDFQIVIPMAPKVALELFWTLVRKLQAGTRFVADGKTKYDEIFGGDYKAKFVSKAEGDREVYRLLIPDVHGRYDDPPFNNQF